MGSQILVDLYKVACETTYMYRTPRVFGKFNGNSNRERVVKLQSYCRLGLHTSIPCRMIAQFPVRGAPTFYSKAGFVLYIRNFFATLIYLASLCAVVPNTLNFWDRLNLYGSNPHYSLPPNSLRMLCVATTVGRLTEEDADRSEVTRADRELTWRQQDG